MIRLMLIGHAYLIEQSRGKLRALAQDPNIDLHLVCPENWREPQFGRQVLEPQEEDFQIHSLPVRFNGKVRWAVFNHRQLSKLFDRIKPQVVQIEQEPASLMAGQCLLLARRKKAGTIVFTWDNLAGANRFPLDLIGDYVRRRADRLLAGNQAALALLTRQGVGDKAELLPQIGIDALPGKWKREAANQRGFVVGYVGRLLERKGVSDLVEAFAAISGPKKMLLVGEGPERRRLADRISELGLKDEVEFVGGVPHAEVEKYLSRMSVLVLPSRSTEGWAEQFGHVLIEAMSAGVAVVGSSSGAIPEVIGEAGIVFPEGRIDLLTETLQRLLDQPDERRELAGRGQERVKEKYTNEAIARRTGDLVREIFESKSSVSSKAYAPDLNSDSIRKIILIKPDHFGDLVLALPALDRLRQKFPEAGIDLVGLPEIHRFSQAYSLIDRIIPFTSPWIKDVVPRPASWPDLVRLIAGLRREKYDLAVNLRHDFRDLLLTRLAGAKLSLGYDARGLGRLMKYSLPAPGNGVPEARRWTDLLSSVGLDQGDDEFCLQPLPEAGQAIDKLLGKLPESGLIIAVHFRSRNRAKNWPEAQCRELIRRLTEENNATVIIIGIANESSGYAAMLKGIDHKMIIDAVGRTDLVSLPVLLSRCAAFIGVDSGPAQLAALMKIPAVVIFSGTNEPDRWRPVGDKVTVLSCAVACAPCSLNECNQPGHPCLSGIGVDQVMAALPAGLGGRSG